MNEENETPEAKAHRESQEYYAEKRRKAAELEQRDQEMSAELERQQALLPPELTDGFLATLIQAARVVGWSTDHIVVVEFVQACFGMAGKEPPADDDLRPFYDP